MNRMTMTTVCVVLVLLGMAAFAASVPDNDGAETEFRGSALDVSRIQNEKDCTFMGTIFKVIKDADTIDRTGSLPGLDIIIDSPSVKDGCFEGSSVRTVLLTDKVKSIGKDAFKDCTDLESFTRYGKMPLSIGADAFVGCADLRLFDIRGDVSVEGEILDSGRLVDLLTDPEVTSSDIPHRSLVRIGSLGGLLNGAMFKDGTIKVSYIGQGMLEMRSDDGIRTGCSNTITQRDDVYSFEPFSGKDSTIAHRTIHIDFVPEDIEDRDIVMTGDVVELLDLTNGDPDARCWRGWYDTDLKKLIGKSIDRETVKKLDVDTLKLRPDSSDFTLTYETWGTPSTENPVARTSITSNWSSKYISIPDTQHYRCIGWIERNVPDKIFHPVGSEVRTFKSHSVDAVWVPLDEYVYTVTYLNVDGTVLNASESYGHGMKASIGDMTPADETSEKMLDGWLIDGEGKVLRSGDKFTMYGNVKLVPSMKDRPGHEVDYIVDGVVYSTQFAGDNFPMTVSCDDPLDAKRIFTGWCSGEIGPLFNRDSAILDGVDSLNATWREKREITLAYMSEGERIGAPVRLLEKDIVTVGTEATKPHHNLVGWSDGDTIHPQGSTFEIICDTVLTAVWEEMEKISLTYHPYGQEPASLNLYPDETTEISSDHGMRERHIFLGWSSAENGTVEHSPGDSVMFDSDTDLYTIWREALVFTASYFSDGQPLGEPTEIYEASVFEISADAAKAHHILKGWTDGASQYANGDTITVTGNIVLDAVWEEMPKYALTYRLPSGDALKSEHYPDEDVEIASCPEKVDGKVFIGWSESEGTDVSYRIGDMIRLVSDLELHPCWRASQEFTVSFQSDGAAVSDPLTFREGDSITVHADVSKEHHTLKGWSDGERILEDGSVVTIDRDLVFSAVWEEMRKFTLTYHPYGAEPFSVLLHPDEETMISAEHGIREGFLFLGWSLSEDGDPEYAAGEGLLLENDLDLYTVWRLAEDFTLSYVSDEKPLGDPIAVKEGESVTVHADVSKEHHTLKGWSDGSSMHLDGSVIMISGNIVLTAVWEEMPKYTVTYHPLGSDPIPKLYYIDETATVMCEPGEKTGFSFIGWSATENGEVLYRNGDAVATTEDISLYPVWKQDEESSTDPPVVNPPVDPPVVEDPSDDSDDDYEDDWWDDPRYDDWEDDDSTSDDSQGDDTNDDSNDDSNDDPSIVTPPVDDPSGEEPADVPQDDQIGDSDDEGDTENGSSVPVTALAAVCALVAAIVVVVIRRS